MITQLCFININVHWLINVANQHQLHENLVLDVALEMMHIVVVVVAVVVEHKLQHMLVFVTKQFLAFDMHHQLNRFLDN